MYQSGGTIRDALNEIGRKNYVLPAIQREFVWKPQQIEKLFDSLMQGYPIGTFLFWRVEPDSAKQLKFYDFVRAYHEHDAAHCPNLGPIGDRRVIAVLDGQQRLTALNIGLRGSMAWRRKGAWKTNPNAYPVRVLHLNLLGEIAQDDETGMAYEFRFLEPDVAKKEEAAFWFPVPEVLDLTDGAKVLKRVQGRGLDEDEMMKAYKIVDLLRQKIHSEPIINYYEEKDQELEKVLNIFIRMNSGGTVLSYSDLLMSHAVAQWSTLDARKEIHELTDELNKIGAGFDFNHDFVLKAGLMLAEIASVGFKVENFTKANMDKLETNWPKIRKALLMTVEVASGFGLSDANLRSVSALLPIAYYLYRRDAPKNYPTLARHVKDREVVRQWLIRSLLKPSGIWGSGLDTLLTALRDVLKRHAAESFPAEMLEREMARRGKPLAFEAEEIEDLLDMEYSDKRMFLLLSLLFPFVDLSTQFHIDHVFPISRFKKASLKNSGIANGEVEELQRLADSLPNLQLLEGTSNNEKRAALPADWLKKAFPSVGARKAYCDRHMLGTIPGDLAGFSRFAKARRGQLKIELTKMLASPQRMAAE